MKLALNMIVKNEAHVIRRCLDSVRAHIACWTIVDTGSSDGTQDVIRSHLADIPGTLYERPWRDFGSNRTEALQLARGSADYLFVMDADHVLRTRERFTFDGLTADGYLLQHRYAGTEYGLPILLADRIDWRYVGVLHEYVTADLPHRFATLDGAWIEVFHEGARSRDKETYRKDVAILREALAKEPGNARYAFYLAQSLRDAGDIREARDAFRHRVTMQGWDEERWFAMYQTARLDEQLGEPPPLVQRAYLNAFAARPSRIEPLVELARHHRQQQEFALAYLYARHAAQIPRPASGLFIDEAAYAWRALDEVGISAWYAGARQEGLAAIKQLLAERRFPESERARLEANLKTYA
ncbi:MAG TPA: glycosyltransferase [Casimicrobiaceae bacterium]|nr:glycosyltransferase [Casimicrobiaceae bacterium]